MFQTNKRVHLPITTNPYCSHPNYLLLIHVLHISRIIIYFCHFNPTSPKGGGVAKTPSSSFLLILGKQILAFHIPQG